MNAVAELKYVLFDDLHVKWIWSESELLLFRQMWNEGVGIQDIAKVFNCNKRSIVLTVFEQAEKGFIKQRPSGLHGEENDV